MVLFAKGRNPIQSIDPADGHDGLSAADLVAETLARRDPQLRVFCLTGGPIGPLVDAFGRRGIPVTFLAHEQACAMACDGFVRSTGNLGVTLVTNGPGVTNALTGVVGAYLDSIPMVVISGGVARESRTLDDVAGGVRQLGVQDISTEAAVRSSVKSFTYVHAEENIAEILNYAIDLAFSPRQGPVWLEVPIDVQNSKSRANPFQLAAVIAQPTPTKSPSERRVTVAAVIDMLKTAKKPVAVIGGGFRTQAGLSDFHQLFRVLGIPAIATWAGMDFFSWTDPYYIGNFGILGERAPNNVLHEADLLLVLGSRLSIPSTGYDVAHFAPHAARVVVDVDPHELRKNTSPGDLGVLDDLAQFVPELLRAATGADLPKLDDWLHHCQTLKDDLAIETELLLEEPGAIDVYSFAQALGDVLREREYSLCVDMGTACTALVQSFRHNSRGRLVRAHGLSAMGYAIPASIGVAIGKNETGPIVAVAGDGGMQLNIQELEVISSRSLPVKIFCLNSGGYRAIEIMQDNIFSGRRYGSGAENGVPTPDFDLLAAAYGIKSASPQSLNDLEQILSSEMFQNSEPLFVNLKIPELQRHRPRVVNRRDAATGQIVSSGLEEMWPSRGADGRPLD